jgi:glycosyltransferase involved in cell wall biosynthesis
MNNNIISYCCGTWPSIGGVARYDTQLKLIFPERKFFQGPQEKDKMLEYLKTCEKPIIITDNHLACDIPNEYPVLLVHHGVAKTHSDREPEWDPYWRDLCCNGQKEMLFYRKPENTWIISDSTFCIDEFSKYYPDIYPKFKKEVILLTSEMNEDKYKMKFNDKPIILGNWPNVNKGKIVVDKLIKNLPEFEFKQLEISNKNESIESFNEKKQHIYLDSDIFLQISLCEGNSFATLDALINGLVIVASDVGLFYSDIPENCFVKLDWTKNNDTEYISERINYAWKHKEELSKNAREWYMENCRFIDWEIKMKKIVNDFYDNIYFSYENTYFKFYEDIGIFGGIVNKQKFDINNYLDMDYILDFGCGGGYLLNSIKCKNKIGIDISIEALENCKELNIEAYNSLDSIDDEWANYIISNHAFQCVPNPFETLQNLKRKLKKKGIINIVIPHQCIDQLYDPNNPNQHLYTWNQHTFGCLLKKVGFNIISVKEICHAWPQNYLDIYKYEGSDIFHKLCKEHAEKNNIYQIQIIAEKIN